MLRLVISASLLLCSPALLFAQGITRLVDDDGAAAVTSCDDPAPAASTVSAAMAASVSGDTVLVCPGTYVETIDFVGKAIVVRSVSGPAATILDGNAADSVVRFHSNETAASVIEGFTIRNGLARSRSYGGGISVLGASPVIRGNVIVGNRACSAFGISIEAGSPLIEDNSIAENGPDRCSGAISGGGIGVWWTSAAIIRRNNIHDNGPVSGGSLCPCGLRPQRGNQHVQRRADRRHRRALTTRITIFVEKRRARASVTTPPQRHRAIVSTSA